MICKCSCLFPVRHLQATRHLTDSSKDSKISLPHMSIGAQELTSLLHGAHGEETAGARFQKTRGETSNIRFNC